MSSDSPPNRISASLEGVRLELRLDERGRVSGASHRGAPSEVSRILDLLCQRGIGWPSSEWRSHGALRIEYELRPEPKFTAGRGLVTPESTPSFAFVQRLLHALPPKKEEPFWSPSERPEWELLSTDERREKLREALRREAALLGWKTAPDVRLDRSARRWLLWFPKGDPRPDFHRDLLAVERRVRAATDSTVELLLEGKEDRNQRSSRETRDAKSDDLHPGA